ncbi:hypothetical protein NST74_27930 [Paenibacillus sp. FSL F4-0125]|uniref:hypothetical protein n=1 Tax=Paenibacillus sp. FSL F4-0125 TaxID=2954730 RepID=UPI0030F781F0
MYYITACFLLLDPIYISILSSFIGGGGDINGIVTGLGIPEVPIQWCLVALLCLIFFFLLEKYPPNLPSYLDADLRKVDDYFYFGKNESPTVSRIN